MRRAVLFICSTLISLHSIKAFAETNIPAPTKLKKGEAGAGSAISKEEISQVIRKNLGPIRGCYETALEQKPKTEGKITLEWLVLQTGKVDSTRIVLSTISDEDFRKCMVEKVSALEFPKHTSKEPVKISYPFVFSPL